MNKPRKDRRKKKRFETIPGARVEFFKKRVLRFLKPQIAYTAPLMDISQTGLAFCYYGDKMWSTDFNELSISIGSDGKRVGQINYIVTSDDAMVIPNQYCRYRRCGVQFVELSSQTKLQIGRFIQKNTLDGRQSIKKLTSKASEDMTTDNDSFFYVELKKRRYN